MMQKQTFNIVVTIKIPTISLNIPIKIPWGFSRKGGDPREQWDNWEELLELNHNWEKRVHIITLTAG